MSDTNRDGRNTANEIDDLFNYDVPLDDIFQDPSAPTTANTTAQKLPGDGLGLDEEVKVTKSRAPIAKLDENRLLSQNGIPKLRRKAKSKLKFKGKGHEFSDAARLLNFYQLWLDDLYPRAKFADGLAMIEKLGHSRRLQTMRRQWIDEERPSHRLEVDDTGHTGEDSRNVQSGGETAQRSNGDILEDGGSRQPDEDGPTTNSVPVYSIPRQQMKEGDDGQGLFLSDDEGVHPGIEHNDPGDDVPEHDELDDLLREQEEAAFNIT